MVKTTKPGRLPRKERNDALFKRADQHMDRGEYRAAFRLFLAAAGNGDQSSQLNVGYCYDTGKGVRQNVSAALYWYKRAYRRGDSSAAHSIGTVWRDRQKSNRALYWFRRAVKLGNEDSNLEIAKLYLRNSDNQRRALAYLERITPSSQVCEATFEEAQSLLKLARRKLQQLRKKNTIAN
jgi:TPR repeat protein